MPVFTACLGFFLSGFIGSILLTAYSGGDESGVEHPLYNIPCAGDPRHRQDRRLAGRLVHWTFGAQRRLCILRVHNVDCGD